MLFWLMTNLTRDTENEDDERREGMERNEWEVRDCLLGAWCLCSLPLPVCIVLFLLGVSQSALVTHQGKAARPDIKGLRRMDVLRSTQMCSSFSSLRRRHRHRVLFVTHGAGRDRSFISESSHHIYFPPSFPLRTGKCAGGLWKTREGVHTSSAQVLLIFQTHEPYFLGLH